MEGVKIVIQNPKYSSNAQDENSGVRGSGVLITNPNFQAETFSGSLDKIRFALKNAPKGSVPSEIAGGISNLEKDPVMRKELMTWANDFKRAWDLAGEEANTSPQYDPKLPLWDRNDPGDLKSITDARELQGFTNMPGNLMQIKRLFAYDAEAVQRMLENTSGLDVKIFRDAKGRRVVSFKRPGYENPHPWERGKDDPNAWSEPYVINDDGASIEDVAPTVTRGLIEVGVSKGLGAVAGAAKKTKDVSRMTELAVDTRNTMIAEGIHRTGQAAAGGYESAGEAGADIVTSSLLDGGTNILFGLPGKGIDYLTEKPARAIAERLVPERAMRSLQESSNAEKITGVEPRLMNSSEHVRLLGKNVSTLSHMPTGSKIRDAASQDATRFGQALARLSDEITEIKGFSEAGSTIKRGIKKGEVSRIERWFESASDVNPSTTLSTGTDVAVRTTDAPRNLPESERLPYYQLGRERSFIDRAVQRSSELWEPVDEAIGMESWLRVSNTRDVLSDINDPEKPLAQIFNNPTLRDLAQRIEASDIPGQAQYKDVKKLRTAIGERITAGSNEFDINNTDLRRLYNALTQDIQRIAAESGVRTQYNRANKYSRGMHDRISNYLQPFVDKLGDPAQLMSEMATDVFSKQAREFPFEKYRALKKSLRPDEWDVVVGNLFHELAIADSAKQATSTSANVDMVTWVNNYGNLGKAKKDFLFSGGTKNLDQYRQDLDVIHRELHKKIKAQVDDERISVSATGTTMGLGMLVGGASAILSGGGSLAFGGGLISFLLVTDGASKLLAEPAFARWLIKEGRSPRSLPAKLARLAVVSSDISSQDELAEYVNSITEAIKTESSENSEVQAVPNASLQGKPPAVTQRVE